MAELDHTLDKVFSSLQERAKELNCLYEVEQVLANLDPPLETAFQAVVEAIPPGWQYPDVCHATIHHEGQSYSSAEFEPTRWVLTSDIVVQERVVGQLQVHYLEARPREAIGPFLKEEDRLIRTIAERLGHFILFHQLRGIRSDWEQTSRELEAEKRAKWRAPVDLLRRTDRDLYLRVARKMVNHLCWAGVDEAQDLLVRTYGAEDPEASVGEQNVPGKSRAVDNSPLLSGKPFELAALELSDDEILLLIQDWIMEEKASFLPKVLNNEHTTLSEVAEAIRRFQLLVADGAELSQSTLNSLRVTLIRRFLTEQLHFISVAKQHLVVDDFVELLDRVVMSSKDHGRVGGKSSGLFLAEKILRRQASEDLPIGEIRVPRSWYLASEGILDFIEHNDLEEVLQQKYREIDQVRHEYPNIIQLFKNSRFPGDFVKATSVLLDEIGDTPIIVRSSSILEDRLGAAFSGKYKSLFLANRGTKQERMDSLHDAITEVYASVFGPDPIAYRRERDLLDFHEEMGILIQEVVGSRLGDYFLPALAGVAYSNNEFRWSPRIRREDGLIRMVPGLGTRAVDRTADDYPIMVVPGQPNLRANTTIDEVVRYSPRMVDVINLRTNSFESLSIKELLKHCGTEYPAFGKVFSLLKDDVLHKAVPLLVDPERDELVADFGRLISGTPFVTHVGNMLKILQENLRTPVDIEFAYDGEHFYLLQCRPQGFAAEDAPAPIPKDVPPDHVLFSASRYVSNGRIPDITHLVYVDPERYSRLESRADLLAVGKAVSELNKLLPKRQFILMGPGRWGSRGDIKLGVCVTYSDINNTSMLIEIARQTGSFVPDLSFGTHFFQDLVESSIRYLPLYPDDKGGTLDEAFLLGADNLLAEMLPNFEWLADTVRVIDVSASARGKILKVLMNSDLDEAIAIFAEPTGESRESLNVASPDVNAGGDEFWRWRMRMAERIAAELDPERFGVAALYVIGSTKNASAGPSSDIDLIVHFTGSEAQRAELLTWLEGWSLCLGEMNYLRTGYQCSDLLDIHIVTDEDIEKRTSFAAKIGAITDPARSLPLGK